MPARIALSLALAVALAPIPALAAQTAYAIDPGHSSAGFTATHLAISRVRGTFPIEEGTLTLDDGGAPVTVSAVLDAAGLNTENADRDRQIKGSDWLDVTRFPTLAFKSTAVTRTGDGAYRIAGDLTIHGVTKPVVLSAKFLGATADARGRKHVGFSATTTLDRRDYGLNFAAQTPGGGLVVSYDVDIELDIEAVEH